MEWSDIKFADSVRHLCTIIDIKIGYIERKIGISQGYLSRVSSGMKHLSKENAIKIAKLLDSDIDDILSCKETRKTELARMIFYKEHELDMLKSEYRKLLNEE